MHITAQATKLIVKRRIQILVILHLSKKDK
jgi:hypothetical protein